MELWLWSYGVIFESPQKANLNRVKSSYFHQCADDTIIIQAHNSLPSLTVNIESELNSIENWLTLNKLTPNVKKCEGIFFLNLTIGRNVVIVKSNLREKI